MGLDEDGQIHRAAVAHVSGPYLKVQDYLQPVTAKWQPLPVIVGPDRVSMPFPVIPRVRRITLTSAASKLLALIDDAVQRILPDRPIATTLSSGLDSSTVTARAVAVGKDVVAVTWSVPTVPSADETPWAREIAQHVHIPLVEIPIAPESLLPDEGITTRRATPLVNMFDGAWALTGRKVAELGMHDLATGYTGDLLFSGWITPTADLLLSLRWIRLQAYLRKVAPQGIGYLELLRSEVARPIAKQMFPRWWSRRQKPVPWLHTSQHELWADLQRDLVGHGGLPAVVERRQRLEGGALSLLAENQSLTDMGISQLHPLLDPAIVEFALSLPTWILYDGDLDKLVMREAMRGVLPDTVVKLEKVLPGELAMQAMRAKREPLLSLAQNMRAADLNIVNETVLRSEVESFMRGEHDNMAFWNALTLEDWLRRWH